MGDIIVVNATYTAPFTHSWDCFQLTLLKCNPLARTSSYFSLEPRERESEGRTTAKHTHAQTHTNTYSGRKRRKLNTMDAGAWESGFPGFPTHKCTILSSQTYTLIHTTTQCHTHTDPPPNTSCNTPGCWGFMNKTISPFTISKWPECPKTPLLGTRFCFSVFLPALNLLPVVAPLIRHGLSD